MLFFLICESIYVGYGRVWPREAHLAKGYVRFTVAERLSGKIDNARRRPSTWILKKSDGISNFKAQTLLVVRCEQNWKSFNEGDYIVQCSFPPGVHWRQSRHGGVSGGQRSWRRPRRQRRLDSSSCHCLLWISLHRQVPAWPREQCGGGEQWRRAGNRHFGERRDGGVAAEGDRRTKGVDKCKKNKNTKH